MDIKGINSTSRILNVYGKNKINNSIKTENIQKKDRLEISKEARELRNKELDINIERSKEIEKIKESIKNGTYKVDSEKLAKSMVENMRGNKF